MEHTIKERIGMKAVSFVQDGMCIGLGTGSTATAFIHALGFRLAHEKMNIKTVASSETSEKLAKSLQIPCMPIELISHIDLTFDGADEVDPQKRLIKGAGGALLREKILAE